VDRDGPRVAVSGLPHHHHKPAPRTQGVTDARERGNGIGEEHRAESADCNVDRRGRAGMLRRIAAHVVNVAQFGRERKPPRVTKPFLGSVDPEHVPVGRDDRHVTGRLTSPAPDVEHAVAASNIESAAKCLVMTAQLGIVVDHRHDVCARRGSYRKLSNEDSS
jgi:hypothetical protein